MATGTLTPTPYQTVLDANGNPVSGAKINTYLAGTTTPAATYTDVALSVANANPIIADSAGRYVAYLSPGSSYKFVITDSGGSAIRTQDNIAAVPATSVNVDITGTAGEALTAGQAVYLSDGSGSKTAGQWFKADAANTYSSSLPEVGIVPASITSGASGTIRLAGQVTGLSSLVVGTSYYIGTAGALTSTAPSNRRLLGVADTTSSVVLAPLPRADQTAMTITTTSTGTQNDFAPGIASVTGQLTILRCNNASLLTINGFAATVDGARLLIVSIGAGQVDLAHQNASSSAANRLINYATSGNTSLAAGSGTAEYEYDATTARWRLIAHEQGAAITPTYAAGDYTTTGAGGWTVDAGDVTAFYYILRGRTLLVSFSIDTTSVIAATGTTLRIKVPGGFTASKNTSTASGFLGDNATTSTTGFTRVLAAGTVIEIQRNDGAVFTASANNTYVRGELAFEVQ